jgi:hypothetical protein
MTLEQRVRRAERMLVMMAQSGRRTRSEWGFKINSLIYAQMENEVAAREQKERIDMLIQSQMETTEQIRGLAEGHQKLAVAQAELAVAQIELTHSQKLTEHTLRAFIDSLRKRDNGSSSH